MQEEVWELVVGDDQPPHLFFIFYPVMQVEKRRMIRYALYL